MSVYRVHKTSDYTAMSNHHLRNKNLSLKAKGLLSVMLSLPDDWEYSINGLVSICKECEHTIESVLKELKDNEYLVVTKKMPNETASGRYEYEYDIFEKPQKQDPKKQGVEFQGVEFCPQLNTNISNTNILNNNIHTNNDIYIVEFEKLWSKYPKKQGKKEALNHYKSARKKGTTYEEVEKGLDNYLHYIKINAIEPRFIKNGSTWFNQHWEDEYQTLVNETFKGTEANYDSSAYKEKARGEIVYKPRNKTETL